MTSLRKPGFRKAKEEGSKKTMKLARNGQRNPRNSGHLEIKGKNISRNWRLPIVYSLHREIKENEDKKWSVSFSNQVLDNLRKVTG